MEPGAGPMPARLDGGELQIALNQQVHERRKEGKEASSLSRSQQGASQGDLGARGK